MRCLIVDGHSIIFAWPELRKLHNRRPALARDVLVKQLLDYQDWTGHKVVVVFDGTGSTVSSIAEPGGIQVFYARRDQSADTIIERLAAKYGGQFEITIATSDLLEMETANACGAACISPTGLRELLSRGRDS